MLSSRLPALPRPKGSPLGPSRPFRSLPDLRSRTALTADDLRILIKVGACDSIAGGMTRPMMLWEVDGRADGRAGGQNDRGGDLLPPSRPPAIPPLREYTNTRRRQAEYDALGFTTDVHPMALFRERLARFRLCPSTALKQQVGKTVLLAGMLTTYKPVHTARDEPMEFATFDDGHGLIETVLFPDVYRTRGHVLFDQGPFIFRGLVEEEFGAVTVTIQQIERVERMLEKLGNPKGLPAVAGNGRPNPQDSPS